MISVLTLTYQRHHLLEEAIESFLCQDFSGESEMLIVNDNPKVKYLFEHPKVRIINLEERVPSIGKKLQLGFFECRYDHIYRFYAKIYVSPREKKTMIYRWGMNTFHISGMGNIGNDAMQQWTDQIVKMEAEGRGTSPEKGVIVLLPQFQEDYYRQIPESFPD